MQSLYLTEDLFDEVLNGNKTATTRRGARGTDLGPLKFISNSKGREQIVDIKYVLYTTLGNIPLQIAEAEGYNDVIDLAKILQQIYPTISGADTVTCIVW